MTDTETKPADAQAPSRLPPENGLSALSPLTAYCEPPDILDLQHDVVDAAVQWFGLTGTCVEEAAARRLQHVTARLIALSGK